MLTFLNFSAKQLQETDGFKRKIQRVASNIGILKLIYYEIINIESSSLDVLMIDDKMLFYKVHLYSTNSVSMLNSEFNGILFLLGISNNDNILFSVNTAEPVNFNLLYQIESSLSRSMEILNIENSYSLDMLEKVPSSDFNVSTKSFNYYELHQAVEPIVKSFISSIFNFKILNLDKNFLEILAITEDCRLYQYSIILDSSYKKFLNRYLSAILPYEKFMEMKKNLKISNLTTALELTLPSYNSKQLNICSFLSFLFNKYKIDIKDEGYAGEGLKNVYKFFLDTSEDEEEAKKKVLNYFMTATTYDKKKK